MVSCSDDFDLSAQLLNCLAQIKRIHHLSRLSNSKSAKCRATRKFVTSFWSNYVSDKSVATEQLNGNC